MKKKNIFDSFDNADDIFVNRLSEHSKLGKKERKRMYAMSKKKLKEMQRNNSAAETEFSGDTVEGVEVYNRPKWIKFAATAAACAAMVAGIGITVRIMRNGGGLGGDIPAPVPPIQQYTEVAGTETTDVAGESRERPVTSVSLSVVPSSEVYVAGTGKVTEASENNIQTEKTSAKAEVKTTAKAAEKTETATTAAKEVSKAPAFKRGVWEALTDSRVAGFYYFSDSQTMCSYHSFDGMSGIPIDYEIEGQKYIFHLAAVDNIKNASVTFNGDTAILKWESGKTETLSYIGNMTYDEYLSIQEKPDHDTTARRLLYNLSVIDKLGATAGFEYDHDGDIYFSNAPDVKYGEVYSCMFSNTDEIESFIHETLTDNGIYSSGYQNIVYGESPIFRYIDDKVQKLIVRTEMARGYKYTNWDYNNIQIWDVTDTSFTINAEYEGVGYEVYENSTISVVKEDGMWKIDSIS